jgi:hypothetical protein
MARKMKGGFGEYGNAGMQMIMALTGLLVTMGVIFFLTKKEGFTPTVPSAEGDKKVTTPAGNVIMY